MNAHLARRTAALVAVPAAALVLLTACGSGQEAGSGRPSVADITKSLTSGPLSSQLSDMGVPSSVPSTFYSCMAQELESSKLSDSALRAFVNADTNYKASSADQSAMDDFDPSSCMK